MGKKCFMIVVVIVNVLFFLKDYEKECGEYKLFKKKMF